MRRKTFKVLALLLSFCLGFEQAGFAQVSGALDLSSRFSSLQSNLAVEKFRPLHLRYLSFDRLNNNFQLFLDKGDSEKSRDSFSTGETTQKLMQYFFIGISLPNSSFWVNLRPDSPDNLIDDYLAQTDLGKVFLEADLQLKKDTAGFTSPKTSTGKKYWDSLYRKAEELFGSENITIPTLTRPWIVPGEIIIRETAENAYIYKATLKVMLEQDYLKNSPTYNFSDPRLKLLNEYASELVREIILPQLTREINSSRRYAALRQVYYSLILAQWFKSRFNHQSNVYSRLIDRRNLANLTSKDYWSRQTYFQAYQASFKNGEYNFKEPVQTPSGQSVRSYMSGGITVDLGLGAAGSPLGPGEKTKIGSSIELIGGSRSRAKAASLLVSLALHAVFIGTLAYQAHVSGSEDLFKNYDIKFIDTKTFVEEYTAAQAMVNRQGGGGSPSLFNNSQAGVGGQALKAPLIAPSVIGDKKILSLTSAEKGKTPIAQRLRRVGESNILLKVFGSQFEQDSAVSKAAEFIEGRGNFDAYDFRAGDLARFYNSSRGLTLSQRDFRDELIAGKAISLEANGKYSGRDDVAVIAVTQDAYRQEKKKFNTHKAIISHEIMHGVYFTEPAYRAEVEKIWSRLSPGARAIVKSWLVYKGYTKVKSDRDLLLREFAAYFRDWHTLTWQLNFEADSKIEEELGKASEALVKVEEPFVARALGTVAPDRRNDDVQRFMPGAQGVPGAFSAWGDIADYDFFQGVGIYTSIFTRYTAPLSAVPGFNKDNQLKKLWRAYSQLGVGQKESVTVSYGSGEPQISDDAGKFPMLGLVRDAKADVDVYLYYPRLKGKTEMEKENTPVRVRVTGPREAVRRVVEVNRLQNLSKGYQWNTVKGKNSYVDADFTLKAGSSPLSFTRRELFSVLRSGSASDKTIVTGAGPGSASAGLLSRSRRDFLRWGTITAAGAALMASLPGLEAATPSTGRLASLEKGASAWKQAKIARLRKLAADLKAGDIKRIKELEETLKKMNLQGFVRNLSSVLGVPAEFFKSLLLSESDGIWSAKSGVGAKRWMQLMDETVKLIKEDIGKYMEVKYGTAKKKPTAQEQHYYDRMKQILDATGEVPSDPQNNPKHHLATAAIYLAKIRSTILYSEIKKAKDGYRLLLWRAQPSERDHFLRQYFNTAMIVWYCRGDTAMLAAIKKHGPEWVKPANMSEGARAEFRRTWRRYNRYQELAKQVSSSPLTRRDFIAGATAAGIGSIAETAYGRTKPAAAGAIGVSEAGLAYTVYNGLKGSLEESTSFYEKQDNFRKADYWQKKYNLNAQDAQKVVGLYNRHYAEAKKNTPETPRTMLRAVLISLKAEEQKKIDARKIGTITDGKNTFNIIGKKTRRGTPVVIVEPAQAFEDSNLMGFYDTKLKRVAVVHSEIVRQVESWIVPAFSEHPEAAMLNVWKKGNPVIDAMRDYMVKIMRKTFSGMTRENIVAALEDKVVDHEVRHSRNSSRKLDPRKIMPLTEEIVARLKSKNPNLKVPDMKAIAVKAVDELDNYLVNLSQPYAQIELLGMVETLGMSLSLDKSLSTSISVAVIMQELCGIKLRDFNMQEAENPEVVGRLRAFLAELSGYAPEKMVGKLSIAAAKIRREYGLPMQSAGAMSRRSLFSDFVESLTGGGSAASPLNPPVEIKASLNASRLANDPSWMGALNDEIVKTYNKGMPLRVINISRDLKGDQDRWAGLAELTGQPQYREAADDEYIYLTMVDTNLNAAAQGYGGPVPVKSLSAKIYVAKKSSLAKIIPGLSPLSVSEGNGDYLFTLEFTISNPAPGVKTQIKLDNIGVSREFIGRRLVSGLYPVWADFLNKNFSGGVITGDFRDQSALFLFRNNFLNARPRNPEEINKVPGWGEGQMVIWDAEVVGSGASPLAQSRELTRRTFIAGTFGSIAERTLKGGAVAAGAQPLALSDSGIAYKVYSALDNLAEEKNFAGVDFQELRGPLYWQKSNLNERDAEKAAIIYGRHLDSAPGVRGDKKAVLAGIIGSLKAEEQKKIDARKIKTIDTLLVTLNLIEKKTYRNRGKTTEVWITEMPVAFEHCGSMGFYDRELEKVIVVRSDIINQVNEWIIPALSGDPASVLLKKWKDTPDAAKLRGYLAETIRKTFSGMAREEIAGALEDIVIRHEAEHRFNASRKLDPKLIKETADNAVKQITDPDYLRGLEMKEVYYDAMNELDGYLTGLSRGYAQIMFAGIIEGVEESLPNDQSFGTSIAMSVILHEICGIDTSYFDTRNIQDPKIVARLVDFFAEFSGYSSEKMTEELNKAAARIRVKYGLPKEMVDSGLSRREVFKAMFPSRATMGGTSAASPLGEEKNTGPGGIDFRSLPVTTQPGVIPLRGVSRKFEKINPEETWKQIQVMLASGNIPSSERILDYLGACCQKDSDVNQDIGKVLSCITDILRMEEERCLPTDPGLKEILALLETDQPAQELQLALSNLGSQPQ